MRCIILDGVRTGDVSHADCWQDMFSGDTTRTYRERRD